MRQQELAEPVLDYLYSFFVDEPSFNDAVRRALPSKNEREVLEKEAEAHKATVLRIENEIANLVNAVRKGADAGLLIATQDKLKNEYEASVAHLKEVEAQLQATPDRKFLQQQITATRLQLLRQVKDKDWRKLSNEHIRRFLIFLFGENPGRSGNGITVKREKEHWQISFKGKVDFYHNLLDGEPRMRAAKGIAEKHNRFVTRMMQRVALTQQT
jgi:hypothetical protein